jgi:hypothetical protein
MVEQPVDPVLAVAGLDRMVVSQHRAARLLVGLDTISDLFGGIHVLLLVDLAVGTTAVIG